MVNNKGAHSMSLAIARYDGSSSLTPSKVALLDRTAAAAAAAAAVDVDARGVITRGVIKPS